MSINWYPGHMAKTRRLMTGDLKNIDLVCEVIDARVPLASRNPDLDSLTRGKRRVLVLNREDQADQNITALWKRFYKERGFFVMTANSLSGNVRGEFINTLASACFDLLERNSSRGVNRPVKVMIVGIPNVGKSSFINRLIGKRSAPVEDRPGVTKKKQWLNLEGRYDIMDTPGILWPKIEDDRVGYLLAATGTFPEDIIDLEDLACRLLVILKQGYETSVTERYGLRDIDTDFPYNTLLEMTKNRRFLLNGGGLDTEKMAKVFLEEFRKGMMGRVSLETPMES